MVSQWIPRRQVWHRFRVFLLAYGIIWTGWIQPKTLPLLLEQTIFKLLIVKLIGTGPVRRAEETERLSQSLQSFSFRCLNSPAVFSSFFFFLTFNMVAESDGDNIKSWITNPRIIIYYADVDSLSSSSSWGDLTRVRLLSLMLLSPAKVDEISPDDQEKIDSLVKL